MATTNLNFSASVSKWCRDVPQRAEAVFHKAAEKLGEAVTDRTPIDTGYLVASFQASGSQMPVIRAGARPVEGQSYAYDSGPVNLAILSVPIGGTIYMGFSAEYAGYVEYGANGRAPRGMVRMAAQRWQEFVNQAVKEAKAAVRS